MRRHEHRSAPGRIAMGERVEVHDVGAEARLDAHEPVRGSIDVAPRVAHPLELVGALVELEAVDAPRIGAGGASASASPSLRRQHARRDATASSSSMT